MLFMFKVIIVIAFFQIFKEKLTNFKNYHTMLAIRLDEMENGKKIIPSLEPSRDKMEYHKKLEEKIIKLTPEIHSFLNTKLGYSLFSFIDKEFTQISYTDKKGNYCEGEVIFDKNTFEVLRLNGINGYKGLRKTIKKVPAEIIEKNFIGILDDNIPFLSEIAHTAQTSKYAIINIKDLTGTDLKKSEAEVLTNLLVSRAEFTTAMLEKGNKNIKVTMLA